MYYLIGDRSSVQRESMKSIVKVFKLILPFLRYTQTLYMERFDIPDVHESKMIHLLFV